MIEVLKQALDAFHQIFESTPVYHNDGTCIINDKSVELSNKAIASLRQAIAELESQEPVAHRDGYWCADLTCKKCYSADFRLKHTTHPPQRTWQGLTDEEVESYWDWEDFQTGAGRLTILKMVRDIEAKLKEKNNG